MNKFNLNDIVVVNKKVAPLLARYIGMQGEIISITYDNMYNVIFNKGTEKENRIGFWEKELSVVE